ncbi:MAG: hypothetical protein AAB215_07080 [Planctomycetota bacterium]
MPLNAAIASLSRVSLSETEEMLALHRRYFCHVVRKTFLKDMEEKDWVIILRAGGRIVGFSTIRLIHLTVGGRPCVFLFSGDTIVDRAHWQSSAMAGSFGHFMLRMMDVYGEKDLYWFLISKGHRTYRFLPVFFNRFYPAHDRPTPPRYARILNTVAKHRFGTDYDAKAGIVRMARKKDWLRPFMREVPVSRRSDPHVRFFLSRNPDYRRGDELACLADVSKANLNRLAWRVIRQNTVSWHE